MQRPQQHRITHSPSHRRRTCTCITNRAHNVSSSSPKFGDSAQSKTAPLYSALGPSSLIVRFKQSSGPVKVPGGEHCL